jgi:hypothetical protein
MGMVRLILTRVLFRFLILALLVFPSIGCRNPEAQHPAGSSAQKWPTSPLVAVASYDNPGMSEEGKRAEETIYRVLKENGIRCVSAGSGGMTLNVQATDFERGRKIIADTIRKWDLKADVLGNYGFRQGSIAK